MEHPTSRKSKTLTNSVWGLINRFCTLLFALLVRKVFVNNIDSEFLGLEGLFSNILGLFSFVELGFGNAISFNLYKPIHDNDRELINGIVLFYKKVYLAIGIVIISLSLMIVPFVPGLINGNTINNTYIRIAFLVYSLGIAITYFFSCKRTLLFASQRNYISLRVETIARIVCSVIQILALIYIKDYIVYLLVIIFNNLIVNIIISRYADELRIYDKKKKNFLPVNYINDIKNHVKSLAVTDLSWRGISSTDNLIISYFIGIHSLTKNANYSTLIHALENTIISFLGGASASIGDMLTENDHNKTERNFDQYNFVYFLIAGFSMLEFSVLVNLFIELWVGSSFQFETNTVIILSINIFLYLIFNPIADFINYSGLFVYYKWHSVIALLINIASSIILSLYIDVNGVFIGTTITYFYMIFMVVNILSNNLLDRSVLQYWGKLLRIFSICVVIYVIAQCVYNTIIIENLFLLLFIKGIIIALLYFLTVCLIYRKDENFIFFKRLFLRIIHRN